jgi:cytidyltransferase-like protein
MNLLTAELIKDLLPEGIDPSRKKVIGMFGGGFKPPTIGHLEVVKRALQENPEMDALIILVGSGTRNSISQDESLAIWNIYKKYLPNKVRVMASPEGKAPIAAIYSYAKKNPDKEVYWFLGAREGNEEDFQDIMKRTQSLRKGDYSNLKVKEVVTTGAVSGTKARQALLNQDKDTFIQFLPDIPEVDEIWDLLVDIVSERINFTPDFITKDDIESIDNLADEKLAPIEVDLSGNHFFDRLNDPRNFPDISIEELEDFFDKLSDEKDEFIDFLKQYREIVVKDTETNINIPFMKLANKAIAKTIMRKKNFSSSTPILPLEEGGRYDQEVLGQSRYLINLFKASFGKEVEGEVEGYLKGGDPSEDEEDEDLKINYMLSYKFTPDEDLMVTGLPFIFDAEADRTELFISASYDPNAFPASYNDFIAELKDTLRHELEHVGQFQLNKPENPSNSPKKYKYFDYFTFDFEIPAFVRGLNKKARTKKITFTQAMDDYLGNFVEDLSDDQMAKIKRIWVDYAKKNVPGLKLQESKPLNENLEGDLESYTTSLSDYMSNQDLNIQPYPSLEFIDSDEENAGNIFGKTAYYMPSDKKIVLYTLGRHPKDILRSFAHEMIHHHQNLNGTLGNIQTTNTNEDDELDIIEREAYEQGNIMFRNWTDSLTDSLNENLNEDLTLSPFDYDQDGNESRIKRDINNKKGWRRLGSKSAQNDAIKKYLDKYTSNYKWGSPPKSDSFPEENKKMYKTPYIMYVHLLQTSEGKNNIIDALKGVIANEPDNTLKQVLQALTLVFMDKEDQFKKVYLQYKDMIENNAKDDDGANPFSALKYADENFTDKEGIFTKFVRNGWSAGKFNLNESFYLDIPKFNQPKTIQQYLIESINEINLSKENAADINGDLTGGTFAVDDITYEYSIKNIPNPYKDLGLFYNIQFTPRGEVTSIPKGGKENYIKILSTMRKIIVDFMEQKNPDYVGISSLDNSGSKNYHTVYNRLTSNPANLLPGYFRKDSNLEFDSPQGKGRFIVLKSKQKIKNEN